MADKKPLNQIYHEEVEALKKDGTSNADAIREVATKHGKNENAVRGGLHQYKSKHLNGSGPTGTTRRRRTASTVDDFVANARQALESGIEMVDREVAEAKAALDAAQAHYDDVQASASDRKADLEKKLTALS